MAYHRSMYGYLAPLNENPNLKPCLTLNPKPSFNRFQHLQEGRVGQCAGSAGTRAPPLLARHKVSHSLGPLAPERGGRFPKLGSLLWGSLKEIYKGFRKGAIRALDG